jgi:excisionase family DNA binding protein
MFAAEEGRAMSATVERGAAIGDRQRVTSAEAGRLLGLGLTQVGRLIASGQLKARRVGRRGRWRIELTSVRALLGEAGDGPRAG